jgi:error-prone DNA polymerase
MAARFAEHPEAVAETARLAQEVSFDLFSDLGYRYPGAESETAGRTLAEVCGAAFAERYPEGNPDRGEARGRLEHELGVIEGLGLSGFFLLHHEILELAREVAAEVRGPDAVRGLLPPGRGRGSSVASIVCYLTGLSHIDPVARELAIGRFLHEEIRSLPDIDLDFPREIRERLIPRVHERYGRERSALVAAFPTFRARGAIRELGKVLGLPPGEIERVARAADGWGGPGSVAAGVAEVLGEERARSGRWAWLGRLAEEAHGLPRHLSQHSGGMIVATRPLIDCCPVVPAAMAGRKIVQWDKDSCADAGLLKIDLLGLGMLSAVERCVELIARHTGERIDLSRIPCEDPATFRCIQSAETTGVFQIESRAQMGSLRRTRPENLEDLTIQVALVRPGPIVGGAVNPYIERRARLRADPAYEIPYEHDSLREPLRCTLGTIIFQDQVIEVARAFAGFTVSAAESLRRAMSRKRSREAIERHHREFVQGALRTHSDVDVACAERVWEMVAGFAGFGFPKAHGAAFGLLAYQSTWLRVHHPAAFLCALLDEQPMGFYAPDSLIHEAQRRGVVVLAPDVNESRAECTIAPGGEIRLGLGYVKGVHREDVAQLVDSRERHGPYRDLPDLAARSGVSRVILERLAWSGACDGLVEGPSVEERPDRGAPVEDESTRREGSGTRSGLAARARRRALWELGIAKPAHPTGGEGLQLALELESGPAPALRELGEWERTIVDYATTGVSIENHPLALLRARLDTEGVLSSADLERAPHGANIVIAGLVIARQRPSTAGGVTFLLLEDESGTVNLIVPPSLYERSRLVVRTEPLVLAAGRLERHPSGGGAINVLVRRIQALPVVEGVAEGAAGKVTPLPEMRAVAPPVQSFAQGRRR